MNQRPGSADMTEVKSQVRVKGHRPQNAGIKVQAQVTPFPGPVEAVLPPGLVLVSARAVQML